MSDGEHDATLDRWRASAPWERFSAPSPDDGADRCQAEPPVEHPEGDAEKVGSHADGALSVADLIAKIGAPTADRPSHHRVADEAYEPDEAVADIDPHEVGSEVPIDLQDTQVIDIPAYSLELVSELPDLRDSDAANTLTTTTLTRTRRLKPNAAVDRSCWPRARWRHCSPCWR